jgi:hypothetical protein
VLQHHGVIQPSIVPDPGGNRAKPSAPRRVP